MPVLKPDFNGGNITMSSRELVELCEKHVMRDIKVMLEQMGVSDEGYAQIWTNPKTGRNTPNTASRKT